MRGFLLSIGLLLAASVTAQDADIWQLKIPTWQELMRVVEAERRDAGPFNWIAPPGSGKPAINVTQTPQGSSATVTLNGKSWRFDTSQPFIRVDILDNKVGIHDRPVQRFSPFEEMCNGMTKQLAQRMLDTRPGHPGSKELHALIKMLSDPAPQPAVWIRQQDTKRGSIAVVRGGFGNQPRVQRKLKGSRPTRTDAIDTTNAIDEEIVIGPRRLPIEEE